MEEASAEEVGVVGRTAAVAAMRFPTVRRADPQDLLPVDPRGSLREDRMAGEVVDSHPSARCSVTFIKSTAVALRSVAMEATAAAAIALVMVAAVMVAVGIALATVAAALVAVGTEYRTVVVLSVA